MNIDNEESTMEIRITDNSPSVDLAPGEGFAERAAAWLRDAEHTVSRAIEWSDAEFGGQRSEEMELLFTNRQADHLAIGLKLLAEHFARAVA
ncbi:hypothetical protein [Shinella zoogloeoides]|uniref:hypothetical protein n=1 Tax=Shinella zoogloeoides TaxID=352475 RepID=UPI0028B007AE|nr:hypothetical protein [Shinella zoogloeoides]